MLFFCIILLINGHILQGHKMKIFTPENGMTTASVKEAFDSDIGNYKQFAQYIIQDIHRDLLLIGGLSQEKYSTIPIQGSDTYAIESILRTVTPKKGKVLVLSNGYFGNSLIKITAKSNLNYFALYWSVGEQLNLQQIEDHLKITSDYTTVAVVHIEASSSIINPLQNISKLMEKYLPSAVLVADTFASYGCLESPFNNINIHYLLVSPSGCIQAFQGVSFVIAKKEALKNTKGNFHSYTMDLNKGEAIIENKRTPIIPAQNQLFAATHQAIVELFREGIQTRIKRYKTNRDIIQNEFVKLGFVPLIPVSSASYILTTFYYPQHVFIFSKFQEQLEAKDIFISPRSLTDPPTFRISHIGAINETDCIELVKTAQSVLLSMKIATPLPPGPHATLNNTSQSSALSVSSDTVRRVDSNNDYFSPNKQPIETNDTESHSSVVHHFSSTKTRNADGQIETVTQESWKNLDSPKAKDHVVDNYPVSIGKDFPDSKEFWQEFQPSNI